MGRRLHEPVGLSWRRAGPILSTRAAAGLAAAALVWPLAGAAAAAPGSLARRLDAALATPAATSAALALDLASGEVLYARNPALPLAPASTEKLVLTYGALAQLGPAFRIRTDLLGEGRRSGPVWNGDLVLVGRGDPTLTRGSLRALAAQVRAAGIHRVTGGVAGDESYFDRVRTARGWKATYFLEESAPLGALAVDGGAYRGRVTRAPALVAAAVLEQELHAVGVRVARGPTVRPARLAAQLVASVRSAPLARIVRRMDLESDNFTAELLLKQLGAMELGTGTTAAGASVLRAVLARAGVPLAGVRLVDGSGLSQLDRLTPQALVAVLRLVWEDPELRTAVFRALPVAGRSGTLEHRMRGPPARDNVVAKTGTTRAASALAGYVSGRVAFAVLQNGRPVPTAAARRAQDRFASVLAAQ